MDLQDLKVYKTRHLSYEIPEKYLFNFHIYIQDHTMNAQKLKQGRTSTFYPLTVSVVLNADRQLARIRVERRSHAVVAHRWRAGRR